MVKQIFTDIPSAEPETPLLDKITRPELLRELPPEELQTLANELRHFLLYTVGQTGGHFGAGLGVIELTIALHYVFNTPYDRIVWDVGHQTYPHKILTGRKAAMATLRTAEGISGFPKRSESPFDAFGVGHSSTSISAALGMAVAAQQKREDRHAIAVIGDGAMTGGMAFEALHHAAHTKSNLLVILNDNQMSISANEGGLASYFAKIWVSKFYHSVREGGKKVLSYLPPALELARRTEEHMKGMVSPATLFEELGFNYIGPVDGHDLGSLTHALNNMKDFDGPQLLHVFTQKGHGFTPAEQDPIGYHAINKILSKNERQPRPAVVKKPIPKYQDVFGHWLCDMAAKDERLFGITPAMREGSGMVAFSEQFPDRYHDVAIAEQHAVTFAAGLACEEQKPVVAIYSTVLQRGYDQLIHDVAIQNLDVLFAIDRAGIVGEDGATHAGAFDLSYLQAVPNMLVMAPSDENETCLLLNTGFYAKQPAAVRYPRGPAEGVEITAGFDTVPIGKSKVIKEGANVAILNFGALLHESRIASEAIDATLIDMRFVKPLDQAQLLNVAKSCELIVTVEENALLGGAGSSVALFYQQQGMQVNCLHLGLPDRFIDHGKRPELLSQCGLTGDEMLKRIQACLERSKQSYQRAAFQDK